MIHKNIRLNPHTLLFEAVEAALKYEIDPFLEPSLKSYFQNSPYQLLSGWYKTLNEKEIKKVKCSSA